MCRGSVGERPGGGGGGRGELRPKPAPSPRLATSLGIVSPPPLNLQAPSFFRFAPRPANFLGLSNQSGGVDSSRELKEA